MQLLLSLSRAECALLCLLRPKTGDNRRWRYLGGRRHDHVPAVLPGLLRGVPWGLRGRTGQYLIRFVCFCSFVGEDVQDADSFMPAWTLG